MNRRLCKIGMTLGGIGLLFCYLFVCTKETAPVPWGLLISGGILIFIGWLFIKASGVWE